MKKVFSFWEPKESIPGYIRLCLDTWRGNLPDYEVEILDFRSLGKYLSGAEIAEIRCPELSFAMQADCVRCALLKKYGGIWLDADTVMTRPLDPALTRSDVTMVANREAGRLMNYGAYIYAARPETRIVSDWHRALLPRVRTARRLYGSWFARLVSRREWKVVRRWDYFENAILDPMTAVAAAADYACVDKDAAGAFPEETLTAAGTADTPFDAYVKYWFSSGEPGPEVARGMGLLMLHNSWTPKAYREMTADEFLKTDTRLAALLRRLTAGR